METKKEKRGYTKRSNLEYLVSLYSYNNMILILIFPGNDVLLYIICFPFYLLTFVEWNIFNLTRGPIMIINEIIPLV